MTQDKADGELTEALLEGLPVGVVLFDGALRCVRINPTAAAIGGTSVELAQGRTMGEVLPELAPQLEPIVRLTLESGLPFTGIRLASEQPGVPPRRWIASSFLVRRRSTAGPPDVGVTLVVESAAEVDAALRDREALFRGIFERAPIGMVVLEWHGHATRMNQAFRKTLGYSDEEFRRIGVQGVTHPDDFAADRGLFQRLMAGELDHYTLVKRYLRSNGEVMWGQLTVSLARDAAGDPALIISAVEDITERKRAEEERERLIHELEEALHARELFLSIASHELKTPLTPLLLMLQSLHAKLRRVPGEPPPRELKQALRQVRRLSSLVESLLDVSRIGTGRFEHNPEPLDLSELAREVVERLRPEAEHAGCALTLSVVAPAPVHADRLRIEQVLVNLLVNAIKFGMGKPIELSVAPVDAMARLAVRDHGIGIPRDQQQRIFERFERAVSEQYGGLGLGLYIARQIIEAHGGRLSVESEPGQGATFIVELPTRQSQAPRHSATSRGDHGPPSGGTLTDR